MKKRILTTIGFGLLTTGGGASIVSLNLSSCSSTITITSYNASTPASSIAQASCSYSSKDVEKDDA
jgi:hypothetical protein